MSKPAHIARRAAVSAALASLLAASAAGQETVTDIAGRPVGVRSPAPGTAAPRAAAGLESLPAAAAGAGGAAVSYPAGYYLVGGGPDFHAPAAYPSTYLFLDGTLEYFPLTEWDLGDIETGDIDGDGLRDIVFSIARSNCDSIPGTRPRIWIQTPDHRFRDETDFRIPALSTSTFDVDLFDADGDDDLDILLSGYSCLALRSAGTILINDGAGTFSDETSSRLPAVPEFHILYFSEPILLDADDRLDIAAILMNVSAPLSPVYFPYLFMNTGDGHFWPDNSGRLLQYGTYGFFNVEAADLTGDGLQDLLFLNLGAPSAGVKGGLALFRNTGNGFMADETASRLATDSLRRVRDVAIADVDLDGDPDLLDVGFFYGGNNPQVVLLKNAGDGTYAPAASPAISALDGWFNDAEFAPFSRNEPDLFFARVAVGMSSTDLLLLNNGGGAYTDSSELLPSVVDFSVSAAACDHDGDGDLDLVVGNSAPTLDDAGQNRLYLNQRFSPPTPVTENAPLPGSASLLPNYPNPFNPATTIRFTLREGAAVTLSAANAIGRTVMSAPLGYRPPGTHDHLWQAGDLPAGVYFVTLTAGGARIATRPAVLLR